VRHFPADTQLLDWLTVKGIAFDVITDHDLDREGAALLRPYRAVATGSHPEYHTPNTLHALQSTAAGVWPISAATGSIGALPRARSCLTCSNAHAVRFPLTRARRNSRDLSIP